MEPILALYVPFCIASVILWLTWKARGRVWKKIELLSTRSYSKELQIEQTDEIKLKPREIAYLQAGGNTRLLAEYLCAELAIRFAAGVPEGPYDDPDLKAEVDLYRAMLERKKTLRWWEDHDLPALAARIFGVVLKACFSRPTDHAIKHLVRRNEQNLAISLPAIRAISRDMELTMAFAFLRRRLTSSMSQRGLLHASEKLGKILQALSDKPINLTSLWILIPLAAIYCILGAFSGGSGLFGGVAVLIATGLVYAFWLLFATLPAGVLYPLLRRKPEPHGGWLAVLAAINEAPRSNVAKSVLQSFMPLFLLTYWMDQRIGYFIGPLVVATFALASLVFGVLQPNALSAILCTLAAITGFMMRQLLRDEARTISSGIPTPAAYRALRYAVKELKTSSVLLSLAHWESEEDPQFLRLMGLHGVQILWLLERNPNR